ncbi:MAG TPA: hypothetical protein VGO00_17920, partial [Kofleriaceae bacterium]|nr:hypothetical protein [Kofleriaceae bacterium]
MAPQDGDSAPDGPSPAAEPSVPAPRAVASDDAFAQTVAPTPSTFRAAESSAAPHEMAGPGSATRQGQRKPKPSTPPPSPMESDATVAAPTTGPIIQLPEVKDNLYRADHEIARGGMGRIVAAEDRRLGRKVALKELIDPTDDQLGRFEREALITARLQHPGIVPVYEAGRWENGAPFFAMKLVSGQPLDRVIADAEEL